MPGSITMMRVMFGALLLAASSAPLALASCNLKAELDQAPYQAICAAQNNRRKCEVLSVTCVWVPPVLLDASFCGIGTTFDASKKACVRAGTAKLGGYPGYSGDLVVRGEFVAVDSAQSDAIDITYSLTGLEPNASGGWHVHSGDSCGADELVGGHDFGMNDIAGGDPWTGVQWTSDAEGVATGTLSAKAGFTLGIVMGGASGASVLPSRTLVVHNSAGMKVACGVFGNGDTATAYMAPMPGYDGTAEVRGSFEVTDMGGGISANYDLTGLVPNSSQGWHIHSGISCASASQVGGHFFGDSAVDPWTEITVLADAQGNAVGTTFVPGFSLGRVLEHTVVTHDANGVKVACGVLETNPVGTAQLAAYPSYKGTAYTVSGTMRVRNTNEGLMIEYDMVGLEGSKVGGFHVHSGTSCADHNLVGGHYEPVQGVDPWTQLAWTSDPIGTAIFSNPIADVKLSHVLGHTVVVHAAADGVEKGARIACGVLYAGTTGGAAGPAACGDGTVFDRISGMCTVASDKKIVARMGTYPAPYDGALAVRGSFEVSDIIGGIEINYELTGLEPGTAGGWHIHAGSSCATNALAGGHLSDSLGNDPWQAVPPHQPEGVTTWWQADADGKASGKQFVASFSVASVTGKTLVVHDGTGARAACGVLGPDSTGYAALGTYPGYAGATQVTGTMTVTKEGAGVALTYELSGLEASTTGGMHVHSGTSCATHQLAGGHYWGTNPTDPWNVVSWESDANGDSHGTVHVSGFSVAETARIMGQTFVVHASKTGPDGGARIACGVFQEQAKSTARLGPYPDFSGKSPVTTISGTFAVQNEGAAIRIEYSMMGLEPSASGGWHIHSGSSCDTHEKAGGHFFGSFPEGGPDPWATEGTWASSGSGDVNGSLLKPGFSLHQVVGRTLVVHDSNGKRAACAVLLPGDGVLGGSTCGDGTQFSAVTGTCLPTMGGSTTATAAPAVYPTYEGDTKVQGTFVASDAGGGGISITYELTGLEPSKTGGWHIHSGKSCASHAGAGGHFYGTNVGDPWNVVTWEADADGKASGTTAVQGFTLADVTGHTVVVHASADGPDKSARIACGVLQEVSAGVASMGKYPNYDRTGGLGIKGAFVVTNKGSQISLKYSLIGLEPSASGGWHVHSGVSCETHAQVGGHYYALDGNDPWTGVQWSSDASGTAFGVVDVAGFTLSQVLGLTIVVHADPGGPDAGARVACGVIRVPNYNSGLADASACGDGTVFDSATGYCVQGSSDGVAAVALYPGYDATAAGGTVTGSYTVRQASVSGSIALTYQLTGLEPSATGGWHVHSGVSCASAQQAGGHFFGDSTEDPWLGIQWTSDADGKASGEQVVSGFTLERVMGHTVVVHGSAAVQGARIGCGVISEQSSARAVQSKYPGYSGAMDVQGAVEIRNHGDAILLDFDFIGLEKSATGGFHIHSGVSCTDASLVGGHYSGANAEDPWAGFPMWTSDAGGAAVGSVAVPGFMVSDVLGRTLVVHAAAASGGARIGCGVIVDGTGKSGEQACGAGTTYDRSSGTCIGTGGGGSPPTSVACRDQIEAKCEAVYSAATNTCEPEECVIADASVVTGADAEAGDAATVKMEVFAGVAAVLVFLLCCCAACNWQLRAWAIKEVDDAKNSRASVAMTGNGLA